MSRGAILITGAAQRLGAAIAETLAAHGYNIAIHYNTSKAPAEKLRDELIATGVQAEIFAANLSDNKVAPDLIDRAQEFANGELSGLVNCAASFDFDLAQDFTPETLHQQVALNAVTPTLLARELAARLKDGRRACVVNFLDFKLVNPYPDHFSYTISKYALAGATETLARALAPYVRVNAIAPGYILPAPDQPEADYKRLHADTPLKYGPTAGDIANAARFLLESPAITGQTLYIDAGRRFVSYERDMAFQ